MTLTRREALEGVAALAAARYGDDYDLANVDEWTALGSGLWTIETIDATDADAELQTPHSTAGVELGAESPSRVNVWYDADEGVRVGVERDRDADEIYASANATLSPDAARHAAAAIFQAAEELEARREAEADA